MNIILVRTLVYVTFLVLVLIIIEGKATPNTLHQNAISISSPISPWVKNVVKARAPGCDGRRWVCNQGKISLKSVCCWNRCVDVTSDMNNCGLCGIRCPLNWHCCGGLCRDINLSIFNCGKCGHRCPIGVLCIIVQNIMRINVIAKA
ncbi:Stigma-specific STIG1-like protein 4, partial [Mucuna pruriens]